MDGAATKALGPGCCEQGQMPNCLYTRTARFCNYSSINSLKVSKYGFLYVSIVESCCIRRADIGLHSAGAILHLTNLQGNKKERKFQYQNAGESHFFRFSPSGSQPREFSIESANCDGVQCSAVIAEERFILSMIIG